MDEPARDTTLQQLQFVLRARFVIVALAFACSAVLSGGRGDWDYFVEVGRQLVSEDGLAFYRVHSDVQTGAMSLLVAATLSVAWSNGFIVQAILTNALGFWLVILVDRWPTSPSDPRDKDEHRLATLLGGTLLGVWWGQLGATGHLDDAVVLAAAVVAVNAQLTDRVRWSGFAVGLALTFKPWAIFFVPLTLALPLSRRQLGPVRQPGLVIAGVLGAMAWLPFIIAEPSSLRRLSPTVLVADDAVLRLIGLEGLGPHASLRIGQLVLGTALVFLLVAMSRAHAVLAAAIAVRLLADPGTWNYYSAGLVLGCIVWEGIERHSIVPWLALVASIGMLPESIIASPELRAGLRLVSLLIVLGTVTLRSRRIEARVELA